MIYALDTNIISYYLKGNAAVREKIRDALTNNDTMVIPPIVYYEIRRGFLLNPAPTKEKVFERMCAAYTVGTLSIQCLDCAAKLYSDNRPANPEDADILIAAFCIVGGYTLVTANTRHFERMDGLQYVNWAEQTATQHEG